MASGGCQGADCLCKLVGCFPLANEKTQLEYPKPKRKNKVDEEIQYQLVLKQLENCKIDPTCIGKEDTNGKNKWVCKAPDCCNNQKFFSLIQLRNHLFKKYGIRQTENFQPDQIIYNMGNGAIAHTPDEAMDVFFEREFEDVKNCSKTPHKFKCIPDSYNYGPIVTKVAMDQTEGVYASIGGLKIEEKLVNKLRNAFEELGVKNSVMISGFRENPQGKNDPQLEIDILIICKDTKTIIQIESKKSFDMKAFKQLNNGYNYFNSKIPFLAEHGWQYVKVAYFEEGWRPEENCDGCNPFVLIQNSDIFEWLKKMKISNTPTNVSSTDPTYLFVLKFIFYQMYQHENCISQDDLLKQTDKNIETITSPEKVLFLNKIQFDLLNTKEDCKRVAFLSQFGTGKTTLLKEKARRLLNNGQKVAFIIFKDMLIRGDSLLLQSYKEEFKEFKDLAKFIQIPRAGSTVNEALKNEIKINPDFHFMMDEVPICRGALESKILNEISQDPSLQDVCLWFACQSEHAPDQILLKDFFICPDMPHPLRYAASLLKITKLIKDKKGDTNFPSDETNPDVFFNRGLRAFFFTLKRGTNLACVVEQIVHILEHEKVRTLIKIDFHQQRILQEFKLSRISERLIVLKDSNDASEEILANLTDEKILVVCSKDNGFIRGFEFSIVIHFTQNIDGDQVEMIYSRCKSKLIIVCNEDMPKELWPNNFSCDFAKLIPVNDELMPQTFETAIKENQIEHVLREIRDKNRPLPVDATNKASQTGLMVACIHGALEVAEVFLDTGAKLDAVDFQGWASIHHAAKKGCLKVMKKVTEEILNKFGSEDYKLCLTMKTNQRETALHIAAEEGHWEIVQHLVGKNFFDVNDKTIRGWTPLHLASSHGHSDVVRCLVNEFKADANLKNDDGQTPLHLASLNRHSDVVRCLVNEFKADANLKNDDGWTPLHLASFKGHLDVVRCLVNECKADVNLKDKDGWTPLHLASSNGHLDVVRCLVNEGKADVNLNNNHGQKPLHLASFRGHLDVVRCLVNEFKADANLEDNHGWTPLHVASSYGQFDVVNYLSSKVGKDINQKDKSGMKPIDTGSFPTSINVASAANTESTSKFETLTDQEKDYNKLMQMCKKLHLSESFVSKVKDLGSNYLLGANNEVNCIKKHLENNIQSCELEDPITFLPEIGFSQDGVDLFINDFKGSYELCNTKALLFLYVDNVLNSRPAFQGAEELERKGLEEFSKRLGLTLTFTITLKEEMEELDYYPDLVSHFLYILSNKLQGYEVIDESVNITEILQGVGFNVEVSDHLHQAILKDTFGWSLFHWIEYYIREKLVDEDTIPGWISDRQNVELNQSIQTSEFHPLGPNQQIPIKSTRVTLEMLEEKLRKHNNNGSESDEYWYHSTSPASAYSILSNGIHEPASSPLLHLGRGFYVSNNITSVKRYLRKAWIPTRSGVGVVLVYRFGEDKQNEYRDRRLSLLDDFERNEQFVNFYCMNYKRNIYLKHPENKPLVLGRDTGVTKPKKKGEIGDPWYARNSGENQMRVGGAKARQDFVGCLHEVLLIQSEPETINEPNKEIVSAMRQNSPQFSRRKSRSYSRELRYKSRTRDRGRGQSSYDDRSRNSRGSTSKNNKRKRSRTHSLKSRNRSRSWSPEKSKRKRRSSSSDNHDSNPNRDRSKYHNRRRSSSSSDAKKRSSGNPGKGVF